MAETPTRALTVAGTTTPRALVDDPRALDDDALREIVGAARGRGLALDVATTAATVALTAAVAAVAPLVAPFAAVPVFLLGRGLAARAARRSAAVEAGVTERCIRLIEKAMARADLRRFEWRKAPLDELVARVRVELERG